ncbi:MAG TPA: flagellar hook protein FlgE [Deltaproteobacteria bacterium]|nr:flagellar hook protein FlgE [Deltaproteobacteria bacterium]
MNSSLYAGISGLNANMKSLSVIGNNVANVNTIGFKTSRPTFADVLSQSATGSSSDVGLGVTLNSIQQLFTQGAFETTSSPLDMAISGDGFFILKNSAGTFYSRAGQFSLDKNGYIVNPDGLVLQGYMANAAGNLQSSVSDLQLTTTTEAPNATSSISMQANLNSNANITGFVFTSGSNDNIEFSVGGGATITASLVTHGGLVSGQAYSGASVAAAIKTALESQNGVTDTYSVTYDGQTGLFTVTNDSGNSNTLTLNWASAGSTAASLLGYTASSGALAAGSSDTSDTAAGAFNLSQAGQTSNFSTPVTVYDSLGNSHTVTLYFRKDSQGSTGNIWEWYAVVGSSDSTTGSDQIQAQGTLTFNNSGALYNTSATTYPTGGFDFSGGATQNQTITFDFGTSISQSGAGTDGIVQYGSSSGVSSLSQDGYAAGTLQQMSIDQQGVISGVFTNGRSRVLGQVLLADFTNPGGLTNAGANLFTETTASGQALIGSPGSAGRGTVLSSTLELSNVDISNEFVKMITSQRGFQANSRIITTTDEILAELVNLKR